MKRPMKKPRPIDGWLCWLPAVGSILLLAAVVWALSSLEGKT